MSSLLPSRVEIFTTFKKLNLGWGIKRVNLVEPICRGVIGPQNGLLLFSGPYFFRSLFQRYGRFKIKNGYILKMKPGPKKCHCAKKFLHVFLHQFRWSKKNLNFFSKIFFGTPLRKFFFSKAKIS